jgi:phosphonate transport system substrate-binding protein
MKTFSLICKPWQRFIATLLIGGSLLTTPLSYAADDVIRVTGIPDENPTELARKNQPLVDFLEKKLGKKVIYIPVTDYGAAVSALSAGKIDFAWLGGFTFVQARHLAGAEPLAMRDIDRKFKSVFIANTAAGIEKPEDFKGKTFAFGSKSSTSGHLMPRHYLLSLLKIDPEKDFATLPVYSGAHDATVKLVESGKIQGGALNIEVWNRMLAESKFDATKIKLVWTSPEYVDYVWAVRKGVEPKLAAKFKKAFLNLDPNVPEEKAVLDLQGAKVFVAANQSDFDSIEKVARDTGLLK